METPIGWQPAKEFVRLFVARGGQLIWRLTGQTYVGQHGTAIVFAPHQDDETLGCGALIASKRNSGHPVHVAFITDGAGSHREHSRVTPAEIAAIRAQEARQALAILGVDSTAIHFLNEPDGTLACLPAARRDALVARLAALITRLAPAEFFLPCSSEGSTEHTAAFELVMAAAGRAGTPAYVWEYPVWLWWNTRALLRQLARPGRVYRAPTGDFLSIKRHAIARYLSQSKPLPPQSQPALPRSIIRLLDVESEYFFRVRPALQPLPAPVGYAID